MSSFKTCNYTIFINEQTRFDNLLDLCKNSQNEKIIIYTRFKYVTLLFSKLFNFNVDFSFIHSKYYGKYSENDLNKFIKDENKILLTDKIIEDYVSIPNLTKIICYDIDPECLKFFNYNYSNKISLSLLLLQDNNNSILNNLINNENVKISENTEICKHTAIEIQ
tara:strand:+ start:1008 stop:1502 length:495 start_codon:yes stop_codon:yes gene_type:complete